MQKAQTKKESSTLRLGTIIRLRWIAVIGQAATVLAVHWGLGFKLPVGWCFTVIALSAWLNIFLRFRFANLRRLRAMQAGIMLGYDLLQLTALLYLTGGLQNPFAFLLLIPVTIAAATQASRITLFLGALALASATFLSVFHLPLPWPPGESPNLPNTFIAGQWVAVLVGITFMGFYAWLIALESRQMSDALAATELVLAREQKLTALDGLAAAAAHELGTPLATIVLVAKELQRECPPDSPVSEDIVLLTSQAQRCREILTKLTQRRSETDYIFQQMSLGHLIEEVVAPHRALGADIEVIAKAGPGTELIGPYSHEPVIQRNPGVIYGLGNIIENACEFAQSKVIIYAEWTSQEVTLSITDDGPGLSQDVFETLGEPYVTTRPAEEKLPMSEPDGEDESIGLGLGFFIAKTLLERSGATLHYWNKDYPDSGAVIQLIWNRRLIDIGLIERMVKAEMTA